MPSPKPHKKTKKPLAAAPPPIDLKTAAANAIAALQQIADALPIDDTIDPNDVAQTKVANRVSLKAMGIAAAIFKANPKLFPQFDVPGSIAAVQYLAVMGDVTSAASGLATSVDKSMLKQRVQMANSTLALYAVLKGSARLPTKLGLRKQITQLGEALSTTPATPRAGKVTTQETQQAATDIRQAKKAALAAQQAAAAAAKAAKAQARANAKTPPTPTPSADDTAKASPPPPAPPPPAPLSPKTTPSSPNDSTTN